MPVTLARPSGRTALGVLAAVTAVGLPWAWVSGLGTWDGRQAFWLWLGALLLEPWVVSLPGFGAFPLASPFYLAMLLRPGVGPVPALTLAYLAALVRVAVTRASLGEVVVQGAPVLAATLVISLLGPYLSPPWVLWLACAQAWLLVAWQAPRLVAPTVLSDDRMALWGRVHERTPLGLTALGLLGLGLGAWPDSGPSLLLALPILLALRQSMRAAFSAEQERETEILRGRLSWAREERDQAREAEFSTRRELSLLEDLTRALARNPDPVEVMDRILTIAGELCPCESVVIFGPVEGRLVPQRVRGPHAERLASAVLLDLGEPLVEAAWQSGQPQRAPARPGQPRLLPQEHAAAFPLGSLGVLYLGDSRAQIPAEVLGPMRMLASHAQMGLRCAHYFRSQKVSLEQYAQANQSLLQWGAALARALEAVATLASTLDPQVVEERLRAGAAAVLPPHRLAVLWPERLPEGLGPAWQEVARVVLESGRPLLFEELQGTRFESPEARSLVAVPMVGVEGPVAVLLATAEVPGQFARQHQDLLSLLAYQAGAAYHSARIHQSLAEAYRRLQESEAQLVTSARTAAIGQLAAGVAHELNTPLGSIILALESADKSFEKRPERAHRLLERAVNAAQKAQSIVARLLFYSREGTARGEEFDLNEVVGDTLTFVGQQLEADGVKLSTALHPDPLPARGGASAAQQILLNLLYNARDAVLLPEARGREVLVSTHGSPGEVALTVRDQGPGLPPELWDRAFEPFFTTKPVGHGAGLGLYTSRQLATQAQGRLEVASPSGQGATFCLRLPRAGEGRQGV